MKKLLLVDGNSMLFRTYYATLKGRRMTTSQGIPTNAVYGFINLLKKAMNQIQPDAMLVAWDTGKPTFRHNQYEAYKGTRKELDEELILQMPIVREYLDASNITRYEAEGYEADDIIGSMAKSAPDMETFILTSDKDLLQLVDDSTRVLLMKTGLQDYDTVDVPEFRARYGLEPAGMVDLKSLMGDASDNIPGVKGVGEKTALKLLHEYGDLDGVYAHIDEIKGKLKEKLENDKEQAYLSKELATIYKEMDLPFSMEDLALDPCVPQDFYRKYEMRSLLQHEEQKTVEYWPVTEIEKLTFVPDGHLIVPVSDNKPFLEETLYGFVFAHGKEIFFLSAENAKADPYFLESLDAWGTWNAKALMHMLDRNGLPVITPAEDFQLAAFLLHSQATNPDALVESLDIPLPTSFRELDMKSKGGPTQERALPVYAALLQGLAQKQAAILDEIESEQMHRLYYEIELPLVPILYDMETTGIDIDQEAMDALRQTFQEKLDTLSAQIHELAGKSFNIDSTKQLGEVLYDDLGLSSGGKKRSTAAEVLEKLKDVHPIVPLVLEYRKYSKLMSTYIVGLSKYIVDGKIHTTFNQTMTQTGRLSSSDPNLQNISVRDEEGKLVRALFTAPAGSILLSADYSQIELRMLAHMADEQVMIQAFKDDVDIHTRTATQLFNVEAKDVTEQMRRIAKTVNFGIIYGQTDFGLSQTLDITRREAKEFMRIYFASYPNIHRYTSRIVEDCEENGYVSTLLHRRRYIPEIKDKNFMTREFGKRAAMNAPIQGSAADLIKIAMIAVADKMKEQNVKSKLLLQIHDELILQVPEDEKELMVNLVQEAMDNAMQLQVPLKADVHTGANWAEAK